MKVSKGLATYAGLVAALGQYLAAVAVFLEADNQSDAAAPLVTATATLLTVIVGRMQQAKALAATVRSSWGVTSSTGASNVSWGTASRAATVKPGEFDREPPAPPADELRDLHDGEIT